MKKVYIDPGHGGIDPGAVGELSYESNIVLSFGKILSEVLSEMGIETKMSRTADVFVGTKERPTFANNWGADIFVSIHCNGATSKFANGTETLVKTGKEESLKLAKLVQDGLVKSNGFVDRGIKFYDNLGVLNGANMPAILIELGFITNIREEKELNSIENQKKWAKAVGESIREYLGVVKDVDTINVRINGFEDTVSGFNKDGVIYSGIRELATKLGYDVGWDGVTKTVILNLKK